MLAGFAVERAVQAVEGVGQWHEAGGHVGQGFRLLPGPGVEGLARGVGVVGLAGALEVVEHGARARAGLCGSRDRRLPARAPPQAEAQQSGASEDQGAEFPAPQGLAVDRGVGRRIAGRRVDHQARIDRDLQGSGRQAAVFQMVFKGVPPDYFHRRQFDRAATGRHQRLAVFATADQATVAVLVAEHRLIRITTQAAGLGAGQRWKLRTAQAFGFHDQAAGQRVTDLDMLRFRVPVLAQGQATCRQPWQVGGVGDGFGLDRQQQFAGADAHQFAGFRRLRRGVRGGLCIHQGGIEDLRRDDQFATVLRVDRIAHFDHAVAHAVDVFLVGARLAELLDACIGNLQRWQAAVVVKRHRVVDAQRQDRLGLHVHAALIEAGVDEDRGLFVRVVLGFAFHHLYGDRLALDLTQFQRRNHHAARLFRQQRDDPAGRGAIVATEGIQLVDLACAAHVEQRLQRRQVRLAELRHVGGLQGQFDRLSGAQTRAIDAGDQLGCLGLNGADQQGRHRGEHVGGEAGHRVFP